MIESETLMKTRASSLGENLPSRGISQCKGPNLEGSLNLRSSKTKKACVAARIVSIGQHCRRRLKRLTRRVLERLTVQDGQFLKGLEGYG